MYNAEILKELIPLKENSLKTFQLENFYGNKQSRIRKLVPFTCSQTPHRLFAMLVLSL